MSLVSYAKGNEGYSIIEKDHKKGLVNKRGRILIPPEYEDLGWTNGNTQLMEDVIGFKKGGLWGLLNTKNEKVTEPVYSSIARFNDDWIVASRKLNYSAKIVYGIINARGKAEIPFQYHRITVANNLLHTISQQDDQYMHGIMDDKAKPLIPADKSNISVISSHLFEVSEQGEKWIYDTEGNRISNFSLDSVTVLNSDYLLLHKNGKTGVIASTGKALQAPTFKEIKYEDGQLLARDFGVWEAFDESNQLIQSYHYDQITPKGQSIYKVELGNAQALIHKSDSLLTSYSNYNIQMHFDRWILVNKENKYGIIDFNGQMLLEPVYDTIVYSNELFLVKSRINGVRGWSIYNHHKKLITDQVYDQISPIGENYFNVKRGGYWGLANSLGKEIIFCKYDSIVEYSNGKLLVEFLGEDGILNVDGSWEILPQQKDIEIVDEIRYLIRSPYGSHVSFYPKTRDFSAEYFLYKHEGVFLEKTLDEKYGLLDATGRRIIKPEYDEISLLQDDSIYFASSQKGTSFITKSGKILSANDLRFEEIRDMEEEFIGVKIDGRWGFVDINGKLRIANQYDDVGEFNEGLAPIKILGRWGYINKREDIIVQPKYDSVSHFLDGLCLVVKKGKYGLINAKGKQTLECEYDEIIRLSNGGFLISNQRKIGLVNKQGRLVIMPKFEHVEDLNNGYVIASKRGKYGMLSNAGVSIIPMIYDNLIFDPYNDLYLAETTQTWSPLVLQPVALN